MRRDSLRYFVEQTEVEEIVNTHKIEGTKYPVRGLRSPLVNLFCLFREKHCRDETAAQLISIANIEICSTNIGD